MRAMRVSLPPLPSLVFKYACTPRQHCAVGPVTSTSSQSSRKRKVLWNFTRLSSVVENIQRRTRTYASKSTLSRTEGWGWTVRSVTLTEHGAITLSWRRCCSSKNWRWTLLLILSVCFYKIVKKKAARKREWTVLVLWRRRACAFSCDRRQRCMFVTDRFGGVNKKCLAGFFWIFVLLGGATSTRSSLLHSCAPIRFFQGCTYAARASTAPLAAPASM